MVGSLDGVYMHAPGIAEVVFKYKDDALEAFKKYNQRNLDGQPMHCKMQPASRARLSAAVPTGYGHRYVLLIIGLLLFRCALNRNMGALF